MIWTYIKRGFGYGLGGRVGWELGGMLMGLVRKIVGLALLAVGAYVGVPAVTGSLSAYDEVKQRYEKPAKPVRAAAKVASVF